MIEYRCTCRRGNTFYCFNDQDVKNSKRARSASKLAMAGSVMSAADGQSVSSLTGTHDATALSGAIRDLTRCPRCGSIDIAVERCELPN